MKVQGPGGIKDAGKTKKKSSASSADNASFDSMLASADAKETQSAASSGSIAQVDALLSIQEAEDPTQGGAKKRMRQRADKILNMLDDVRDAMLGGQLTVGHMVDIADVVASHREKITDPALTGIMDEIDLRAQVELAKMRVAMDKKSQ